MKWNKFTQQNLPFEKTTILISDGISIQCMFALYEFCNIEDFELPIMRSGNKATHWIYVFNVTLP